MAKISIHIVTWNSAKHLQGALDSLRTQTCKDFSLIVVDNASSDASVALVREHYPEATVLRNSKNQGFSRGHNQAIALARRAKARYVLVMNPDTILTPDFLERAVAMADSRREIGTVGGKLRRVLPRLSETEEPRFTDILDSCGIIMRRSCRALDRGAGEQDAGRYDADEEVFGISGALALYRLEALDALEAASGEAFDEDFFAYKEDVDIAWRLRLLGWRAMYVPAALAFHYRAVGAGKHAGSWRAFLTRMRRPVSINRLSTRNQLLTIMKNIDASSGLLQAPFIFAYEVAKFIATLLCAPSTLPAYGQALVLMPKMRTKRLRMMRARTVPPLEIRKWFR